MARLKDIIKSASRVSELLFRLKIKKNLRCNYLPYVKKGLTIVGSDKIYVGEAFCADTDVKIEAWKTYNENGGLSPEIHIGDRVFFNSRTHVTAIQKMVIGNDVLTGSDVIISDNNHGSSRTFEELNIPPRMRNLSSSGPIVIEDNVWIGDKAVILGGITIGKGSVIGAGAVVTTSIPRYSIAVGNPARVIRSYREEKIDG